MSLSILFHCHVIASFIFKRKGLKRVKLGKKSRAAISDKLLDKHYFSIDKTDGEIKYLFGYFMLFIHKALLLGYKATTL